MPYVTDLLREASTGRLAPVDTGRPYAWRRADVLAFWESVRDGSPTGTYLIWRKGTDHGNAPRSRLGPIPITAKPSASLLLDGHCRAATLAWSLRMPGDPMPDASEMSEAEAVTWGTGDVLVADVRTRSFAFASEQDCAAHPQDLMPLGCLMSTARFIKWTRAAGASSDDRVEWVDDLGVTLRDSVCLLLTVSTSDPDVALAAMLRHAASGVPSQAEEIRERWNARAVEISARP